MPLPSSDTIGNWDITQLQRFISQAVLVNPPALPNSLSLDSAAILGDLDIGGNVRVGGWVQGGGGVATTVGPTFPNDPQPGHIHLLQLDVSPYQHELMIFDHILQKWVSATPAFSVTRNIQSVTNTSYNYWGAQTPDLAPYIWVLHAQAFYDAGLRPQTQLLGWFTGAGTSNNVHAQVIGREVDNLDTAWNPGDLWNRGVSLGDITQDGSTKTFRASSWSDRSFATAPAKSHWLVQVKYRLDSAGTGSLDTIQIGFRWVHDA